MGGGWLGGLGGGWLGGGWQGQGGGWQGQGGGWAGGGGSEGLYAMRTDRPLVAENVDPDGNAGPRFPLTAWDSDLFALTFLADFFTAVEVVTGKTWTDQGPTTGWETDIINALSPIPAVRLPGVFGAGDKIDDLRILAVTERPEAMGEILNQHQNQQLCFMQLLMMTATSHPHTFFVMKLAARVGEVVMMRLKRYFKRPRPTQYYPTLYPPVPVPGHAAYPAGHALIARLTANVLIDVTKGTRPASPYENSLLKLAANIGENRVIAGLHFHSDISAGVTAADMTHQFLSGMPAGAPTPPDFSFASAMTAAKGEWP